MSGPDWTGLAELVAAPGGLDRFSDAQLRPLLLEFFERISFDIGNPREVQIIIGEG